MTPEGDRHAAGRSSSGPPGQPPPRCRPIAKAPCNRLLPGVAVAAAALLVVLWSATAALAHGAQPRIEVGPERVAPGASLTVRGYDFAYEEAVALGLVGSDPDVPLTTATTDVEGSFTVTVHVPVGLAEGAYAVLATAGHHVATGPSLVVTGTPVAADQGARRGEEDSLLAPMPDASLATAPVYAPEVEPARGGETADQGRDAALLVAVIVAVSVAVAAVGLRRLRPRH